MTNDGSSEMQENTFRNLLPMYQQVMSINAVSRNLRIFPLFSLRNSFLKKISQTKYPTKLFILPDGLFSQ